MKTNFIPQSRIIQNFSVYAINNVLNAAIPFLLLPILTNYLSPAQYGMLSMVDVLCRFTIPFILLGINGAINTAYFRLESEKHPSYISSGLIISLIASAIVFILFLIFHSVIKELTDVPLHWILLVPFLCLLQTVNFIVLILYQAKKKPIAYGKFQISQTILNIGLSLLFVVVFNMNWEGRQLGIICSFFIFMLIGLYSLHQLGYLTKKISRKFIKDILWFGLPLIPHLLSGPAIQFLDRLFIKNFVSIEKAGIYTAAFQVSTIIVLLANSFNQAWTPHLFENLSNITEKKKKKIVAQSYLFMLACLSLILVLFIITPYLFLFGFINHKFIEAQNYILLISIGSAFSGMYFMVANYIFYEKKTYILAWVTFANAIMSICLNLYFIKEYGTIGATYTFVITNICLFISVWILSNKIYCMPWFSFWKKN